MRTHRILGLDFFGGTSREAVDEITRRGGLLVAPAAPSMINLCRDEDYRRALLSAEIAIADSGFMVLLWKLFTGERVPRISGLEHVKRLLEHESVRQPGAVLWVVATETSKAKLLELLGGTRAIASPVSAFSVSDFSFSNVYVAPKYSRPVEDEVLLALVRQTPPKHIVIAVGGGTQDILGQHLLQHLDYRPAIHCIGAALGFVTGDHVRVPDWADRFYVGWLLRTLWKPQVYFPRYWSARALPALIWRYRDRLPPMEESRE
jgi:UDP-N-acetyl-D-mannosaminuronic acid transferase (WecB/TagA/CpsF family)